MSVATGRDRRKGCLRFGIRGSRRLWARGLHDLGCFHLSEGGAGRLGDSDILLLELGVAGVLLPREEGHSSASGAEQGSYRGRRRPGRAAGRGEEAGCAPGPGRATGNELNVKRRDLGAQRLALALFAHSLLNLNPGLFPSRTNYLLLNSTFPEETQNILSTVCTKRS
jgi:hypothetical protein